MKNKAKITSKQVPNPTGKGGFTEHPENRSNGSWVKTETFRYWFGVFKEMTIEELKTWEKKNPENKRTVASSLAYTRIIKSQKDLREFQEVANRSEGMPKQTIEHTDVNEEYAEYIQLCKQYGLNPETGLPHDIKGSKMAKSKKK
jgi:hypothetical protein